jgi:hypothetical protein
MKAPFRHTAIALSLALLTSACASRIPLSKLMSDPGHYDGKTVVTTGQVKRSAGLLGFATYQITDGGSTLTVVTNEGGAPRDATRVEVKGKFHSAFSLGNRSVTVLEEEKRKPL